MIARYGDDVTAVNPSKVYIAFGTNDTNYGLYATGSSASDEQKNAAVATYKANLVTLVERLMADGITDITLMTPPTYDSREGYLTASNGVSTAADTRPGYSEALAKAAQAVKEVASEYGLDVVDNNYITSAVMEDVSDAEEELLKYDRLHPDRAGHFVMAANIIKTIYTDDALVASVEIDADGKTIAAENASATGLDIAEDGTVTYTYKAKSLPMGVDNAGYKKVTERYDLFKDFTDEMNREIVKVTGLSAGNYDVSFDGVVIGTYTSDELSDGINIAANSLNPGQISAKAIIDGYMAIYEKQSQVRVVELCIAAMKRKGVYDGMTFDDMCDWVADNYAVYAGYFDTAYPIYANNKADIASYERQAIAMAQPQTHTVAITKAQ